MRLISVLLAVAAVTLPIDALAEGSGACPETDFLNLEKLRAEVATTNCDGDQRSLNLCAALDLAESEVALKAARQAAVAKIDSDERRQAFWAAETAWCTYREQSCNWDLGTHGDHGSMSPMLFAMCRKARDEQHTHALEKFASCSPALDCQLQFYDYDTGQ